MGFVRYLFTKLLGIHMRIAILFLLILLPIFVDADKINSLPQNLKRYWVLEIQNLAREEVTKITFSFTEKEADSCLGGDWYQLDVESYTTKDESFFPAKQPLSYELSDNRIAIGRNLICDAYLQLGGEFQNATSSGQYISFGWGSKQLGYFTLNKANNGNP